MICDKIRFVATTVDKCGPCESHAITTHQMIYCSELAPLFTMLKETNNKTHKKTDNKIFLKMIYVLCAVCCRFRCRRR